MKKFFKISLSLLLILLTVFSFTACEKKTAEPDSEEIAYKDHRIYDFETGLIGKKLEYKRVMQKDISSVLGAKEGWGFEFEDNYVVELYVFDENSEEYQSSLSSNYISVFGDPVPVKFNGTICIYMNDWQNKNADAIYEIFKNLKKAG